MRSEARPGGRRDGEPGVGVDEAEDLRVRVDCRARESLREPLLLLPLVMLQHGIRDPVARRAPALDHLGREPGVRAVLLLLFGRERVQPPQDALRELPEADVEQAPCHPEQDEPPTVVPDIGADAYRQHGDLRLVERQVVDPRRRSRIVGNPEELARPLERGDRARYEPLEARPGKRDAPVVHEIAHARHELLDLAVERLGALGGRLDRRRRGCRCVEGRGRLRLPPGGRRGGALGQARGQACRRRRRRGRGPGGDAAHEVAHADHIRRPPCP